MGARLVPEADALRRALAVEAGAEEVLLGRVVGGRHVVEPAALVVDALDLEHVEGPLVTRRTDLPSRDTA